MRLRPFFSPVIPPSHFDYVNHMIGKQSVSVVNSAHSLSMALSPWWLHLNREEGESCFSPLSSSLFMVRGCWWRQAAIMNNVQLVPGPASVLLTRVSLDWMPNQQRSMKLQLPSSSLMNILLISLTWRYTTPHKLRFGDLMSTHKLGWQPSDHQNKTVSYEVGFVVIGAGTVSFPS